MFVENIAAFDIGNSTIKVILAKKTFQNFKILSLVSHELDLNLQYEDAVKSALKEIIIDNDFNNFKILVNIPMEKTLIKTYSFPFSEMDKISATIPFEIQETIPFNINDVRYDYQKQPGSKDNNLITSAIIKNEFYDIIIDIFNESGLKLSFIGVEPISLYHCYKHFNKISNENVIQLDLGFSKSIINIIKNNSLLSSRSINFGSNDIINILSEKLKINYSEAVNIYNELNFDVSSLDNNLAKEYYKELKISKPNLKSIYSEVNNEIKKLCEQVLITVNSINTEDKFDINRMLISGGTSNISGLSSALSDFLNIPIVSSPFLDQYKNDPETSNFPLSFGLLISYMKHRNNSINILNSNLENAHSGESLKQFYPAITFGAITIIILLINMTLGSLFQSSTSQKYESMIISEYKKLFNVKSVKGDPIKEAEKLIKNEEKYIKEIESIIPPDQPVLKYFNDVLKHFKFEEEFELINIVINKNVINLTGYAANTQEIDNFKNKLTESNNFDSITYNTRSGKKNLSWFSMIIKPKLSN